jgi:hypothetical protein
MTSIKAWSRRALAVALLLIGAISTIGAQPASAAPQVTPFYYTYGATILQGKMTWYNRTTAISGSLKARSDCRYGRFNAMTNSDQLVDAYTTPTVCPPNTTSYGGSVTVNRPGGPAYIAVWLYVYGGEPGG